MGRVFFLLFFALAAKTVVADGEWTVLFFFLNTHAELPHPARALDFIVMWWSGLVFWRSEQTAMDPRCYQRSVCVCVCVCMMHRRTT
jgi:hypothetical protein